MSWTIFWQGYLLGWLVAWPPGPINAEMLRRVVGRGFWSGWAVGAGACVGDFCWALLVGLGAGLVAGPALTGVLGVLSVLLLAGLGTVFVRGGWRSWQAHRRGEPLAAPGEARGWESRRGGFGVGFGMALLSPWNIAFWLGVIGQQASADAGLTPLGAVGLAIAVISGALTWGVVWCGALSLGARWVTPAFQVATQALTGLLLWGFALRTLVRLLG